MNDDMTTLGVVMALERDPDKNVLFIVCPTGETDQGKLQLTARTATARPIRSAGCGGRR